MEVQKGGEGGREGERERGGGVGKVIDLHYRTAPDNLLVPIGSWKAQGPCFLLVFRNQAFLSGMVLLKNTSIAFLPVLPCHQDCQQPNDFNKPSPKGEGTVPWSKSSMQTKLVACIDNVQASVPLIHL